MKQKKSICLFIDYLNFLLFVKIYKNSLFTKYRFIVNFIFGLILNWSNYLIFHFTVLSKKFITKGKKKEMFLQKVSHYILDNVREDKQHSTKPSFTFVYTSVLLRISLLLFHLAFLLISFVRWIFCMLWEKKRRMYKCKAKE